MTTDNFCFYLQNRLIQTGQLGGQRYSDTSPFSIPWFRVRILLLATGEKNDEVSKFCPKERFNFDQFYILLVESNNS
jgi:hypothetical protein